MARPLGPLEPAGRTVHRVAVGLVFLLLSAACGTRVPAAEVQRLLAGAPPGSDASLGSGTDSFGTEGGRAGGAQRGEGSGGAVGAEGGSSPEASGGLGAGASCTGNPGATDVGVTGTAIEVGASYAESSLVPGQFRPAVDAIAAYFNEVNRAGGVCGRQVKFHHHNDGLNAQKYAENIQHLANQDKVFAMVGSLSAADSGGCGFMGGQHPPKGVPDIGTFALSYCRSQDDNHYSPVGSLKKGIYGCCVDWQWLRQRYGFKRPAVHYLDIEISRDQGLAVVDALVRTLGLGGRGDVYRGEHSPAQFSFAGDVQDMRTEGVDGVWSSMDLNNNVKLLRAMCQQNWHPKVVHLEISAYDPALIQRVGPECINSQNVWMRTFHRPFSNPNPEISHYVSTLKSYCPACRPTTFGLEGWLTAKLFVEALRRTGPKLTRAALYRILGGVKDWTGGGVMGPITPSRRLIYHCNFMVNVRGNGFFQGRDLACGKFYASGKYGGGPVGP
jgi:branched-chain amino acid transport system substrate-binding protein